MSTFKQLFILLETNKDSLTTVDTERMSFGSVQRQLLVLNYVSFGTNAAPVTQRYSRFFVVIKNGPAR